MLMELMVSYVDYSGYFLKFFFFDANEFSMEHHVLRNLHFRFNLEEWSL